MVNDKSTKRPHILMLTVPFPGHCAPFVQLLYQLRHHRNVKVTVLGHAARLVEMEKVHDRGDFKDLEVHFETVFGDPPTYEADPVFPIRAALASAHMDLEFQPMKQRLIEGKDRVGAPTSMIVDMFIWWSKDIADELGISWYPFYSTSSWFAWCVIEGPLLFERDLLPSDPAKKLERVDITGIEFPYIGDIPHQFIEYPEFYSNISSSSR